MEKVIEFNIEDSESKKYLEEYLREENIEYELTIEDRWLQKYKSASTFYQVYCLYVNKKDINKIEKFLEDLKNATIITDGIEELECEEDDEEDNNKFSFFTRKNFLKYTYGALIIIVILIIIGIKITGNQ